MTNIKQVCIVILFCFLYLTNNAQVALENKNELLQNINSRNKESLNGLWQIIIDPLENGYYNHRWTPREEGFFVNKKMKKPSDLIEYDFDSDYQLTVPGDWNSQMEKLYYYEGTVWYKKTFDYHDVEAVKNYLYFEAINYEANVYLNGEKLGTHIGGYTPFQFDVTNKLKNKDNHLIIKVDNKRKREAIPTINTDWWNYGGITRSVHLVSVPPEHIQDYSIQLSKGEINSIEGWVKLNNTHDDDTIKIKITELGIDINTKVKKGIATFKVNAKPLLWNPQKPKLYTVNITSKHDKISDQIGFRTIETKESKILLNGKPIFLKGISIHEEAPFNSGRVTTKEECITLLKWAKELGCNFIRLAHYPHSEAMVREAEKMGFLIWSEIPVYWTVLFDNPDTYLNAENQLSDMISRDKNRAAIILWSVANETPESDSRNLFLKKLTKKVKALDEVRLVTAALDTQKGNDNNHIIEDPLGAYVDVIGINSYCGWYGGAPESCANWKWINHYKKPMIMSEVGAGALQGLHGEANERWTEEYQDEVYKYNIEMMRNIDFLAGASPWILMDFKSHRRHLRRIQNDFNRKGLISEKGIPKKAFYRLQKFYLEEN
ncbi:glycoside hydrolase family 2 protein [Flavivirga jejuensis]|uniref:Beta-glucuronidase n=1 Tax=Flavivirga jejuensis TaxID=870487 RepID=A0ABT8WM98_9FLAO|nr:glycoside hydrolase family 2 TIM barrel-domain containing protein [Flavivirga jejuensis]MDO5974282.1 glycoside hydrolase family 2 TIM barrel-domain containing protein [Flavivirga jejuensis]